MTEPQGYVALDLVGFTDRGAYSETENYVNQDLVHLENSIWMCIKDDTVGITPAEGENWKKWIDGSKDATAMPIIDTKGFVVTAGEKTDVQTMTDALQTKMEEVQAITDIDHDFSTTSKAPLSNDVITNKHVNVEVSSESGVHGIRYFNETLQAKDSEGNWQDIASGTGGGGVELSAPTNVKAVQKSGSVILTWTDPDDVVLDGVTLSKWGGTLVVRKEGSKPTKKSDGVTVIDTTEKNQYSVNGYEDTGLTNGTTYYYGIFPHTTQNLYTYGTAVSATPQQIKIVVNFKADTFTGNTVTVSCGDVTQTQNITSSLTNTFLFDVSGQFSVTNSFTNVTQTLQCNEYKDYSIDIGLAPLIVNFNLDAFNGVTVTATSDNGSAQASVENRVARFSLGLGNWTVSNSLTNDTQSVEITDMSEKSIIMNGYQVNVTTKEDSLEGKTVTLYNPDKSKNKTAVFASKACSFVVGSDYVGSCAIESSDGSKTAKSAVTIVSGTYTGYSVNASFFTIYGVEWDGTATTKWTRTDGSANFTDPVPAVNGGTGSSPFDTLQPWAGMVRSTDAKAGELVAIPKFWFKWTLSGGKLKLQIADGEGAEGFSVSPAHQDRGDGKGERDVVYIGRYHCANSSYKSVTGQSPQVNITRGKARTNIHNLDSTVWQADVALRMTIWMLYLVEFADWDSQSKIGYGCGNNSAVEAMGRSDNMKYHTGTMQANRTTYGVGTQYRYIEGLWDNCYDWCDGWNWNGFQHLVCMNPSKYKDDTATDYTAVGTDIQGNYYPSAWKPSDTAKFGWYIIPTAKAGSNTTYCPDYFGAYSSGWHCPFVGGYYNRDLNCGLFCVYRNTSSGANWGIGCRLQKLP